MCVCVCVCMCNFMCAHKKVCTYARSPAADDTVAVEPLPPPNQATPTAASAMVAAAHSQLARSASGLTPSVHAGSATAAALHVAQMPPHMPLPTGGIPVSSQRHRRSGDGSTGSMENVEVVGYGGRGRVWGCCVGEALDE